VQRWLTLAEQAMLAPRSPKGALLELVRQTDAMVLIFGAAVSIRVVEVCRVWADGVSGVRL